MSGAPRLDVRLISWLLLMPSTAEAQVLLPSYRMVTRDFDVITGANGTLQHLFTIPNMPVYMGVAPHSLQPENDMFADMSWTQAWVR